MGTVVDLSKFASNNEINKWICQVLGLPDDARQTLDHAALVGLLGRALIEQQVLVGSIRNALVQVVEGLIDVSEQSVVEFSQDLVNVIDGFELDVETGAPA